jgi:hypothetical protein
VTVLESQALTVLESQAVTVLELVDPISSQTPAGDRTSITRTLSLIAWSSAACVATVRE